MPLMILTGQEVQAKDLPTMLEEINEQSSLKFLMADWWNAPGIFKEYATGLDDLKGTLDDDTSGFDHCIGGSAFGDKAEVCWRQVGDTFRVVIVAEQDVPIGPPAAINGKWQTSTEPARFNAAAAGGFENPEELEIILWGSDCIDEGNPSTWVEGRIPRELSYPVQPTQKDKKDKDNFSAVMVKVRAYYDAHGRPIIYRRCGLKAQRAAEGGA